MSTKVKVGIAAVIVTALVALIVLDQRTTPKTQDPAGAPAAPTDQPIVIGSGSRDAEANQLQRAAEREFSTKPPAPPQAPELPKKGEYSPVKGEKPSGDDYVILQGDTFATIAKAKYGSEGYASLIAQANPGMKETNLRIGKHIILPPKPEKTAEPKMEPAPAVEASAPKKSEAVAFANEGGKKIYVVQPGDTLSGISSKVYGTMRHAEKIREANNIEDPDTLWIGKKLVIPDLPRREANAQATSGTVQVSAPNPSASGGKSYSVQPGDTLWKIAEKHAKDKGVLEMIQAIVKANSDKLKDDKSLLRVGWSILIPE
jgi:nucleoid-associated protein YgaU